MATPTVADDYLQACRPSQRQDHTSTMDELRQVKVSALAALNAIETTTQALQLLVERVVPEESGQGQGGLLQP